MTDELSQARVAVVGPENTATIQLVTALREIVDQSHLFPYLRTEEVIDLAAADKIDIAFIDLFAFDNIRITDTLGAMRASSPIVARVLYIDRQEAEQRWSELPPQWQKRLDGYQRLYKGDDADLLVPQVRWMVQASYAEARDNRRQTIWQPTTTANQQVFISYSRYDWDDFVAPFVKRLEEAGIQPWIDQDMLVGGDEWMDALGAALQTCAVLTVIISPDAIESRYVRMEYRYFFNKNKPIVPILLHPTELPPELDTIQHIDFTKHNFETAFQDYMRALTQALKAGR